MIILFFLCFTVGTDTIRHISAAEKFIGITEASGKNDGREVEMFLNFSGGKKGLPWCAAFVSYILAKSKVNNPKIISLSALSFITAKSVSSFKILGGKKLKRGSLAIWRRGSNIKGHIGIVTTWNRDNGKVIEGNASPDSSSGCDGVYIKRRKIEPLNYFRIVYFTEVEY